MMKNVRPETSVLKRFTFFTISQKLIHEVIPGFCHNCLSIIAILSLKFLVNKMCWGSENSVSGWTNRYRMDMLQDGHFTVDSDYLIDVQKFGKLNGFVFRYSSPLDVIRDRNLFSYSLPVKCVTGRTD